MLYRINTENKNKQALLNLVSAAVNGFSTIEQTGYCRGKPQPSICIKIVTTNKPLIDQLCKDICQLNDQNAVLLEAIPAVYGLITKNG